MIGVSEAGLGSQQNEVKFDPGARFHASVEVTEVDERLPTELFDCVRSFCGEDGQLSATTAVTTASESSLLTDLSQGSDNSTFRGGSMSKHKQWDTMSWVRYYWKVLVGFLAILGWAATTTWALWGVVPESHQLQFMGVIGVGVAIVVFVVLAYVLDRKLMNEYMRDKERDIESQAKDLKRDYVSREEDLKRDYELNKRVLELEIGKSFGEKQGELEDKRKTENRESAQFVGDTATVLRSLGVWLESDVVKDNKGLTYTNPFMSEAFRRMYGYACSTEHPYADRFVTPVSVEALHVSGSTSSDSDA